MRVDVLRTDHCVTIKMAASEGQVTDLQCKLDEVSVARAEHAQTQPIGKQERFFGSVDEKSGRSRAALRKPGVHEVLEVTFH